jgi:hypothetical protein
MPAGAAGSIELIGQIHQGGHRLPMSETPDLQTDAEGIIKYQMVCRGDQGFTSEELAILNRTVPLQKRALEYGWLGQEQGISFGNLSCRLPDGSAAITPSQQSHRLLLPGEYSRLVSWNLQNHSLEYCNAPPSSESMTHLAILDADPAIGWVLHIHNDCLFSKLPGHGTASTPAGAAYGTTTMSEAIGRIAESGKRAAVMAGHQGGLLFWTHDSEELLERLQHYQKLLAEE